MKTTALIAALAMLGATAVLGSETSNNTQPAQAQAGIKKVKKPKGASEKSVMLTGSYIKQKVRRNGVVTNGANPVYVLDRNAIDLSGAADVSQVLIRTGFRR